MLLHCKLLNTHYIVLLHLLVRFISGTVCIMYCAVVCTSHFFYVVWCDPLLSTVKTRSQLLYPHDFTVGATRPVSMNEYFQCVCMKSMSSYRLVVFQHYVKYTQYHHQHQLQCSCIAAQAGSCTSCRRLQTTVIANTVKLCTTQ